MFLGLAVNQNEPAQDHDSGRVSLLPLGGLRSAWVDVLAASFTLNLLALALPAVTLQTYDRIIPNNSRETLVLLVVGIGVVLVLDAILRLGRGYVTGWAAARFEHRLGCTLANHILAADMVAYEKDGPGVHLDRISAVDALRDFYSGQAILILVDLPFAVLFLAIIGYLAGPLVLVPLVILVIFAALAWLTGRRLRAALIARNVVDDRRYNFIIEVLTGIHTVKGLGAESQMVRRYERLQEASAEIGVAINRSSGTAQALGALFSNVTLATVAGVGSLWVISGDLSIGGLAACTLLAGRSLQPLLRAMGVWTRFQSVRAAKIHAAAAMALPMEAPPVSRRLPSIAGKIQLDGVSFAYAPDGPQLFSNLNLVVEAGTAVSIRGANGSGMTTLLWLIMRLLRPTAGRVMLDGHDLSSIDPASVREQVAYVPQNGILYRGTILDNLTGFRGYDAVEPALEAAARLGLDEAAAHMREGYQTLVGGGAADSVSGGIRQRIAIARALAREPRILLFDEANAHLDGASDTLVRDVLAALRGRTTLVIVSHRPSLLRVADDIYDLRDGGLVPWSAVSPLGEQRA